MKRISHLETNAQVFFETYFDIIINKKFVIYCILKAYINLEKLNKKILKSIYYWHISCPLYNMQILIISNDSELINITKCPQNNEDCTIKVFNDSRDPLDIMSTVCLANPTILIIDDDFLKPGTSHILSSIKKIMDQLAFIFVTSNSNIDLGREISQLGVYYYAVKPLEKGSMIEALKSIIKLKSKNQY